VVLQNFDEGSVHSNVTAASDNVIYAMCARPVVVFVAAFAQLVRVIGVLGATRTVHP